MVVLSGKMVIINIVDNPSKKLYTLLEIALASMSSNNDSKNNNDEGNNDEETLTLKPLENIDITIEALVRDGTFRSISVSREYTCPREEVLSIEKLKLIFDLSSGIDDTSLSCLWAKYTRKIKSEYFFPGLPRSVTTKGVDGALDDEALYLKEICDALGLRSKIKRSGLKVAPFHLGRIKSSDLAQAYTILANNGDHVIAYVTDLCGDSVCLGEYAFENRARIWKFTRRATKTGEPIQLNKINDISGVIYRAFDVYLPLKWNVSVKPKNGEMV